MSSPAPISMHPIQRNILLWVALCFISGGILSLLLSLDRTLLHFLSGFALLAILFLFFNRRHNLALMYTLPLFGLLGLIHTGYGLLPPDHPLHIYNRIEAKTRVTLTGIVTQMPEFNGRKTHFILESDSILIHDQGAVPKEQKPTRGTIRLSFEGEPTVEIQPGAHLMILATVNRVKNYRTPGVFDYQLFLASRSIHVTGSIQSPSHIIPFHDLSVSRFQRFKFVPEQIRYRVGVFIDTHLEPEPAGLYRALLIGSRSGISPATLERYKTTGCMHLLAISGVHMGLLGLMVSLCLAWLMKRSRYLLLNTHIPTLATLFTLLPLAGYALIAGLNTPVLRALIMAAFFLVAVVLRRQKTILPILAAAALVVLTVKPLALFTASFQLSFSAVLAIALIYPRLLSLISQDKTSPAKKMFTYICAAFFVSIAATLGSLPFMLLHFNRFSLIGPFMNLLVEPLLCLWALPIGLMAMPLIYIAPDLAVMLLKIGSFGIIAADTVTQLGSSIPFASLWTITPNLGEVIIYYTLLLLWLYRSETVYRRISLFCVSSLFLLFFTRGLWGSVPGKISEVTFLDIGQGTSTCIQLPHGNVVLLDGGSKASPGYDPGERVIAPFLWRKQLWRIDDVIITHPHSDHFNGLSFIIDHFKPQRLWVNNSVPELDQYRDLLRIAKQNNVSIQIPRTGQTLVADEVAQVTCLSNTGQDSEEARSPGRSPSPPLNDQSLVIKLVHGNTSYLFPGDISVKRESDLIDQNVMLKSDILLAPHHGSRGSGSSQFISAVDPELIVISAGRNGRGQYVYPGHLKKWQDDGRRVLITSRDGTVTSSSDGSSLQIRPFGEKPFLLIRLQ